MCWTRQPQERSGTYRFSGSFYMTAGVRAQLLLDDILYIYHDVRSFAEQESGIDYLQVYISCEGEKLFFIDQLNQEMIESGEYENKDNHCTLMFASEY